MQGGTFHFDPSKKLLEVTGQIVVDHIASAPATDGALSELLKSGKTMVTIEQMATGHWNVKYVTAMPEHHANVAAVKAKEARSRKDRHTSAFKDYDAQQSKADKDRKARERKESGQAPEEVEA